MTESSATTSDECKAACTEDISCIAAEFSSWGCFLMQEDTSPYKGDGN